MAAGEELPGRLGTELVDVAQEALSQALQVAASLSAAVAIGAAILAGALLKRVRTHSELETGPRAGPGAGGRQAAVLR